MKLGIAILLLVARGNAFPTRLTEEQFLTSGNDVDSSSVDIVSGYAQIRRQGRNFGNSNFKFSHPVTVKDPAQFSPVTDIKRVSFEDKEGPVFNLDEMLKEEAEKLKNQVEVASLMAAHAAQEAAQNIKEAAMEVTNDAGMKPEEVEQMIEDTVNTAIKEAEEIIKEELLETTTELIDDVESSTEAVNEISHNVEWAAESETITAGLVEEKSLQDEMKVELIEQDEELTTVSSSDSKSEDDESGVVGSAETDQPPQDLDLGSVQEVSHVF